MPDFKTARRPELVPGQPTQGRWHPLVNPFFHGHRRLTSGEQELRIRFAKAACNEDTLYINREDDSGEPGLRKSKMDYRPIRLVDKYWVTVTKQ